MAEWRLFDEDTVPAHTTAEWYAGRERAPHLDQELHKGRLLCAARLVDTVQVQSGVRRVVDLGAGDGGLLYLLKHTPGRSYVAWGYDLQQSNVDGAVERGVDVRLADVLTGPVEWGEIAVATEMLEHLIDPHRFVRHIAAHSPVLVASSPWTETGEAHYEFHTWAWDQVGYRALLEQAGYEIVAHETEGMFQVIAGVLR